MKNSFSSFCSEQKNHREEKVTEKDIREKYEELKGLEGDELTAKLYEEVKSQKEQGVFDYDSLVENVERLKNFIPQTTYQNMKSLLEKIK